MILRVGSPFLYTCTSQTQLASLKRSKKEKKKIIRNLQETVQQKEDEIKVLSNQIAAKEDGTRKEKDIEDSLELKEEMSLEMTEMKMNIIRLQDEVSRLRTAMKLSQEEASCYQEYATSISTGKIKVNGVL